MRVLAPATLGVLVTSLLVGCSTTDPGQPVPSGGGQEPTSTTTTTSAPATTTSSDSGAPRVATPLDTARFRNDPCLSLTKTQIDALGVGFPGKAEDIPDGKSCLWSNDRGGQIHIMWANTNGLDSVYKARDSYRLFMEVPKVGGLPTVVANRVDRREGGDCTVWVGTSDQTMFTLALSQSNGRIGEPCTVAADVAGQIVATVKEG